MKPKLSHKKCLKVTSFLALDYLSRIKAGDNISECFLPQFLPISDEPFSHGA